MADLRIEELNEAELGWVAEHVALARTLTEATDEGAPTPDALDALWADWLEHGDPQEANDVINIVGLAFGQRLVDDLGMRWVAATDEHGTEVAVHHPAGDALVMPPNLVAKRLETREVGFLRPIHDAIADQLGQLGA